MNMPIQDLSQELQVAKALARQAGTRIMEIYATDFIVDFKGIGDPVTEADRLANQMIVQGLHEAFPQDVVVAEESPRPSGTLTNGRVWFVDPLDGTREFVAKNGEFSVMIGLAINGQAQLGVVYRPDRHLLYSGLTEGQAWLEVSGESKILSVSSINSPQDSCLAVSRSHWHAEIDDVRDSLGIGKEIRCGSVGLKIGLISEGKADIYVEPGPYTSAWDSCGPEAIIKGAGGRFTNVLGQQLLYGVTQLKNTHGLVASNGVCHDQVIKALEPLARGLGLKA